jgi:superfamily II DNA or RNA helicase
VGGPRIRSAVLATRPLRAYAHQDAAVFGAMLKQPRLRFLLADEPGTGKTIMTGMYLVEGRRRGLVPGKTVIVVPAHLVPKWIRDLRRLFGVEAKQITTEIGREPEDLRPDVDVWVVSLDLFTYNSDVRRKVAGRDASWSLVVFDEAHRLTPTSQYLDAARQAAAVAHHLLLLTQPPTEATSISSGRWPICWSRRCIRGRRTTPTTAVWLCNPVSCTFFEG